ncbi:hypothetical protein AB6Q56_21355 [Dechloromonas sp. ARDL1]|uniref:hypothetical protein n=1 Tax=Dechloromonas sp. ARDL1 TaxID=3322121 RepID=UPI003DA714A2
MAMRCTSGASLKAWFEPGATFRTADIFKRHKQVYTTFVGKDDKGHYLLKPEFVILERG